MSCVICGVGRIGADPEFKTVSEIEIVVLNIAISPSRDNVIWVKGTIWDYKNNKYIKRIIDHLKKGKQIQFSGNISRTSAYTKKNGELASSIEIYIHNINFIPTSKHNDDKYISDEKNNAKDVKEYYEF